MLGVHPNTVRAWSDAGRLRYYRINPRGDRRYRLGDLQRFLAAAVSGDIAPARSGHAPGGRRFQAGPAAGATTADQPGLDTAPGQPHQLAVDVDAATSLVADIGALTVRALERDAPTMEELLAAATTLIREAMGLSDVVAWQLDGERLSPRAASGGGTTHLGSRSVDGTAGRALVNAAGGAEGDAQPVLDLAPSRPVSPGLGPELAVVVRCSTGAWGVLTMVGSAVTAPGAGDAATNCARTLGTLLDVAEKAGRLSHRIHRAEALRRVAADLGSRLDADQIAAGLLDHALVLFGADRAALVMIDDDEGATTIASRGLSAGYVGELRDPAPDSLPGIAWRERRPLFSVGYRDDSRAAGQGAAIVQEGYDTLCAVPLFVGDDVLGMLTVYHDQPHAWSDDELDALAALASQSAVAIRTARDYGLMATWAAQLQSIQQLGTRLNGLSRVHDIGVAIATELRELIDYHNVRVYRIIGPDLVPVAMRGQVSEYVDERPEQLRVRLGEGVTGWVAEHKTPLYLPDAANDHRAQTIPGTGDDLDESMLLAPMVIEDQVLGVVVLSKLGLHQFGNDDLRLLVIYASFAAQAMANADATEQLREQSGALERQLRSRKELLQITESILTTLEPRAVLDQIADRLAELVGYDNISIEVYDRATRVLQPLTARGVYAEEYMKAWELGETGVATWVIEHNEPVLIVDQYDDPRVQHFEATGRIHGGLVVVPLRGREGVTGVLTLERLGEGNTFQVDEFELVQVFAAQVSIALQNAEVHRAVEIRARSDALTGLLNHGTFQTRLATSVARGERFGLVMIDLDDFKLVNDALGHQAGDRLLSEIGAAIVRASRDTDAVFRYGGDEFAILLPGADPAAVASVALRVRRSVHDVGGPGTAWHEAGIVVSASFGLAVFPEHGASAASVLLAADRACFVAKRAGPGRIATADEGLQLAAEVALHEPTPVDPPSISAA